MDVWSNIDEELEKICASYSKKIEIVIRGQEVISMPEYKIINAVSSASVPLCNKRQYIAIHYLGVVGQSHELASDGTGAHYYIYWDGTIYQRCSHDAIVWAVGTAGYYTQKHPYARNANTISIELCCKCDGDSTSADDQKWYFTEATQNACVWLVKKLRRELGIPSENVLRHYDIVNKVCPAPYVHNNKYRTSWTWSEFKSRISDGSNAEEDTSTGSSGNESTSDTAKKMRYVVQCGAFSERKNAEAMVRQLQEKGFAAIVKSA